ncbi:hypothetical protein BDR26DRAFT_867648 [Obelidium mucronatum]|nr:hypothetical protein BDR26DRAFT_867648 [Obelidium mucronatum]
MNYSIFLLAIAASFATLATASNVQLDSVTTPSNETLSLFGERDGGFQYDPIYDSVQGFDWWGWDAGTDIANNAQHCGYKAYQRGLRFYTWNANTKVCYFKAPPSAPGVEMRITKSEITYENDFPGAFDVGQLWNVKASTCEYYCTKDGYPDKGFPPCLVGIYAYGNCYLKFPNPSEPHAWAGVAREYRERPPKPCQCGRQRCCGDDPHVCCDW